MQTPVPQLALLAQPNKYPQWMEGAARVQVLGFFLLFFVFSCAVVGKFWNDRKLFEPAGRHYLDLAYRRCVIAGIIIILFAYLKILPRTWDYFGGDLLFKNALDNAWVNSRISEPPSIHNLWGWPNVRSRFWGWTSFRGLLVVVNITAFLAVPAFIAGGISCLGLPKGGLSKDNWVERRERLQTYIYLSAAMLVIAVVFLKAWTQYPGFILVKSDVARYNALVNTYCVFTGIEYTLLLAAYAIPVSLYLSRDAEQLAEKIQKTEEPAITIREIRSKHMLTISTLDVLKSVVALLSPLLTGSIATLTSAVG